MYFLMMSQPDIALNNLMSAITLVQSFMPVIFIHHHYARRSSVVIYK